MRKFFNFALILTVCCLFLTGCGAEHKKKKHYNKGAIYEKERQYSLAAQEYRAAIEIDSNYAPAYLQLGKAELQRKNYEEAAAALEKWQELEPESIAAAFELGLCYAGLERVADAVNEADRLSKAAENNAEAERTGELYFNAGRVYLNLAAHMEDTQWETHAEALFRQAIAAVPEQIDYVMSLGALHLKRGQFAEAEQLFAETYAHATERREELGYELALTYKLENKFNKAQAALEEQLEQNPESNKLQSLLAEVFLRKGELESALSAAESVLARDANSALAHFVRGSALLQQERDEEALNDLELVSTMSPSFAEVKSLLAEAYLRLGKRHQALTTLQDLLKLRPDASVARLRLAEIYNLLGWYEKSVELLRDVLEAEADNVQAAILLGNTYVLLDQFRNAREIFGTLPSDQTKILSRYHLGIVALAEENYAEAERYINKALEERPDAPPLLNLLGILYGRQRNYTKASQYLLKAVKVDPQFTPAHFNLARISAQAGRPELGIQFLKNVLNYEPSNVPAHRQLALLYARLGAYDLADESFSTVIKLSPNDVQALQGKAELAARRGAYPEALRLLEQAHTIDPERGLVLLHKGKIMLQQGNADESAQILREALAKLDAQDIPIAGYIALAIALAAQDDLAAAVEALSKAPALEMEWQGVRALAILQLANNNLEQARHQTERLSILNPRLLDLPLMKLHLEMAERGGQIARTDPEGIEKILNSKLMAAEYKQFATHIGDDRKIPAALSLIMLFQNEGYTAAAETIVDSLITKYPDTVLLWMLKGKMQGQRNDMPHAMESYRKAAALNPKDPIPLNILGDLHNTGATPDFGRAAEMYSKSLEAVSNQPMISYKLGTALERQGETEAAINAYKQAASDVPEACNQLAWLYSQKDPPRLDEALELSRKAVEAKPSAEILDTYGWVLFLRGDKQQALLILKRAYGLLPYHPTIRYHLAAAYAETDEIDSAIEILTITLNSDGSFPEKQTAQELLDNLTAQKGTQ